MIHLVIPAIDFVYTDKRGEHVQKGIVDGYYSAGRRRAWGNPRWRRYVEWKKHVKRIADEVGLGHVAWSEEEPCYMVVVAYFRTRVHQDTENICKGIRDALVYEGPGGGDDKWCCGFHTLPRYDKERPRAEAWLYGSEERAQFLEKVAELVEGVDDGR